MRTRPIADALVQIRRERHLTQADLAVLLETDASSVSKFEVSPAPTLAFTRRYAEALGVQLSLPLPPNPA